MKLMVSGGSKDLSPGTSLTVTSATNRMALLLSHTDAKAITDLAVRTDIAGIPVQTRIARAQVDSNYSCCPLRPRPTPFPEGKSILGVGYGVSLCTDTNAATPLGAWGRGGALYCPLQVDSALLHAGTQFTQFTQLRRRALARHGRSVTKQIHGPGPHRSVTKQSEPVTKQSEPVAVAMGSEGLNHRSAPPSQPRSATRPPNVEKAVERVVIYLDWKINWANVGLDVRNAVNQGANVVVLGFWMHDRGAADAAQVW